VTHDLPIDPALQSLLDASRAERDRRAANYPHVQRTAPHAAGRPLSPSTAAAAILLPTSNKADAVGDQLKEFV